MGCTCVWPSMLSTSLISRTGSSYAPGTSLVGRLTLFASPWDLLEWDLTRYVFRLITRSTGRTGSVGFVTLGRLRLSLILFFVVPFTMRSEGDSTVCSECVSLFPHSSDILTSIVLHSTFRRPCSFTSTLYSSNFVRLRPLCNSSPLSSVLRFLPEDRSGLSTLSRSTPDL